MVAATPSYCFLGIDSDGDLSDGDDDNDCVDCIDDDGDVIDSDCSLSTLAIDLEIVSVVVTAVAVVVLLVVSRRWMMMTNWTVTSTNRNSVQFDNIEIVSIQQQQQ